jgi:hypothetical protein
MKAVALLAFTVSAGWLTGCGTQNNQCVTGSTLEVGTAAGTANHASASPGNQVQFSAYTTASIVSGSGCAVPNIVARAYPAWSSSDAKNVTISSAADSTNGLATCVGATSGAATLTATIPATSTQKAQTATVSLTCQ